MIKLRGDRVLTQVTYGWTCSSLRLQRSRVRLPGMWGAVNTYREKPGVRDSVAKADVVKAPLPCRKAAPGQQSLGVSTNTQNNQHPKM